MTRGKCLTPAELAEAAGADELPAHVADCVACRAAIEDQRGIHDLVRLMPAPPLPSARREAIAAEVMARADQLAEPRTRFAAGRFVLGGLAAAAALLVSVGLHRDRPVPLLARVELAASEPLGLDVLGVAYEAAPPAPTTPPALIRAEPATEYSRRASDSLDLLELRDGIVTVDARNTRTVDIAVRGTTVHVEHAKIRVVARAGVVETVTVFAGSVEVTRNGKLVVVEAGMTWMPDTVGRATAMRAFQTGWAALRDGNLATALTAFDSARDPVIAEDASYWAAVTAERAGNRPDAARRFAGFLTAFPDSPHSDAARSALARLTGK